MIGWTAARRGAHLRGAVASDVGVAASDVGVAASDVGVAASDAHGCSSRCVL